MGYGRIGGEVACGINGSYLITIKSGSGETSVRVGIVSWCADLSEIAAGRASTSFYSIASDPDIVCGSCPGEIDCGRGEDRGRKACRGGGGSGVWNCSSGKCKIARGGKVAYGVLALYSVVVECGRG